jgi:DAK2 domain
MDFDDTATLEAGPEGSHFVDQVQWLLGPVNTVDAQLDQCCNSGPQATAEMKPHLGRASYLGDRAVGTEVAGAAAGLIWMDAIASM